MTKYYIHKVIEMEKKKIEVVANLTKALGIKKEPNYLYFLQGKEEVLLCKCKQQRGKKVI